MMDYDNRKLQINEEPIVTIHTSSEMAPESPIDLSQLSTRRCRNVDLTSRSASESCLAPAHAVAAKKRRFKDPPPPPLLEAHPESLKYRSMSNADLAGYRTPWLTGDVQQAPRMPEQQSKTLLMDAPPSVLSESLKFRCMSDSRLGGAGQNGLPSAYAGYSQPTPTSGRKSHAPNELLRTATDNSQLEFLLRRTASESVLPSSRSGEPAGSAAMEMLLRQQQMLQQHYQHLLIQQHPHQHDGADGGSSSSSSSSSYASPWLLGLFGYTQMIQSLQAAQQQQIATIRDPTAGSGQIPAGPSSPAVAASISGSDGEGGEMEEEDMDGSGFAHGKKRSPRALTGKHVRLGTGASPTTLNTLRLKIQERQRMKMVKKSGPAYNSASSKKNASKLKSRAK